MIYIVADSNIPFIGGVFEPFARILYVPGGEIGPETVKNADALVVRTRTCCDEALLAGSRVGIIATATIGTDHIDTDYCARHGIEVASAAGSNARGVLQWVAATLAILSRKGSWQPHEKTLGIVGVGSVGSLVRQFAEAWGFGVLCSDPPREAAEGLGRRHGFVPLAELAREADVITFHTPLTRHGASPTWHLAGERFFDTLQSGTAIINSARGGVVDELRLRQAVMDKSITACLDTWEGEPDLDRRLLEMAAIATPHIAGYTIQGKANASAMVVEAIARHFGLPLQAWYPTGVVRRSTIKTRISDNFASQRSEIISWYEMCRTIERYCDLGTLSAKLKNAPASFELLRNSYDYRSEYF